MLDIYDPEAITGKDGVNLLYLKYALTRLVAAGRAMEAKTLIEENYKSASKDGRTVSSFILDDARFVQNALALVNQDLNQALARVVRQDVEERRQPVTPDAIRSVKAILVRTASQYEYDLYTSIGTVRALAKSELYPDHAFVCDDVFMGQFAKCCDSSSTAMPLYGMIYNIADSAQKLEPKDREFWLASLSKAVHAAFTSAVSNREQTRTGGMVQNLLGVVYHFPLASLRAEVLCDPAINPRGLSGVDQYEGTNEIILKTLKESRGMIPPELASGIRQVSGVGLHGQELLGYLERLGDVTDPEIIPEVLNLEKLNSETAALIGFAGSLLGREDCDSVRDKLHDIFSKAPKIYQLEGLIDAAYRQEGMTRGKLCNFESFAEIAAQNENGLYEGTDPNTAHYQARNSLDNMAAKMKWVLPESSWNRLAIDKAYKVLFESIPPETMLSLSRDNRGISDMLAFNAQKFAITSLRQNVGVLAIGRRAVQSAIRKTHAFLSPNAS